MLDHGEDARGMSSEVLVFFCASSCVFSGLARGLKGKRVEVVVGPALELDLFSNNDLKDDTGFCQKSHSAEHLSVDSGLTDNGSFVCAILCRVRHGVNLYATAFVRGLTSMQGQDKLLWFPREEQ